MILRDASRERLSVTYKDTVLVSLFNGAIEALNLLDPGNALVQRSVAYLEQLSSMLKSC